jgi:type IV pilus assembly protein PilV
MVMRHGNPAHKQGGALLIEVLVTIAIVVIGLWGLMAVQSRLQLSEVESYQRAQALILLNDMAARIATNRSNVDDYLIDVDSPIGVGGAADACAAKTVADPLAERDLSDWCNLLQGAAETVGVGATRVGAMIGARGCIEIPNPGIPEYMITVVWQGFTPVSAPPASVACGADLYDEADTECVDDLCRRAITTIVRIPAL